MKANLNVISATLQSILIATTAFLCGYYFTGLFHEPTSFVGGLWAVISAIIVYESTAKDALNLAKTRILGTLIGAIISAFFMYFFNFTIVGYVICIGLATLICYLFNIKHAAKLAGITISVILIVSVIEKELHPFTNAGLRFAESAIGTALALLFAYAIHHLNKKFQKTKSKFQN